MHNRLRTVYYGLDSENLYEVLVSSTYKYIELNVILHEFAFAIDIQIYTVLYLKYIYV